MAVFSNRRVRVADYSSPLWRRPACRKENDMRSWESLGDILEYTEPAMTEIRRISTNMNSHRDVLMWMHTHAVAKGPYVVEKYDDRPSHVQHTPPWWNFQAHNRGPVQPTVADEGTVCPQPMSHQAVFFKRLDTGTYVHWPSVPPGIKWVWDIRKFTNPGSIGETMSWDYQDYSEQKFGIVKTCTRILVFKDVVLGEAIGEMDGLYDVFGGKLFLDVFPDWIVREIDPRRITDPLYDPDLTDPNNPIPAPEYGRPPNTPLFYPFNVTDAIKFSWAPEYEMTNGILSLKLLDPKYEKNRGDPPAPFDDYSADGVFSSSDVMRISHKKLYQMMQYASEHWSSDQTWGPSGEAVWPFGFPKNKSFDLVVAVNFYKWRQYSLSSGTDVYVGGDFAGAYGTCYAIY